MSTRAQASGDVARWLEIARGLLERPTAPCREELPKAFVREFVRARPALGLQEDAAGNLTVRYPARGRSRRAPLVIVAHLDHPGFWITKTAQRHATLVFKGGVAAGHAHAGCRVRFFTTGSARATGAGVLAHVTEAGGRLAEAVARITRGAARAGGFAMWGFPAFELRNGFIVTRACDDILGAATALCVMDELARRKPKGAAVWSLLTRAEETGFLGALEAIRLRTVPKNAAVLSLECSKAAGIAPQGDGVAVRVGDGASIFDPQLTAALCEAAESLCGSEWDFRYQRKLMDGGTCEATPFCAYGYRASALALPLGNYHNQAVVRGRPAIGPENVCVADFACAIRLLGALAERPELLARRAGQAPAWLKERGAVARKELRKQGQPRHTC